MDEGVLLPESEDDEAELSVVDAAAVSDFDSEVDFESEEDELSLLELLLLSTGGLGRP